MLFFKTWKCTITALLQPNVSEDEWKHICNQESISLPLLSAAPPLMILATTIAPVDVSLFIVAPLRTVISE